MTDNRDFLTRDRCGNIRGFHSCPVEAMGQMKDLGRGASVVRLSDGKLIATQTVDRASA